MRKQSFTHKKNINFNYTRILPKRVPKVLISWYHVIETNNNILLSGDECKMVLNMNYFIKRWAWQKHFRVIIIGSRNVLECLAVGVVRAILQVRQNDKGVGPNSVKGVISR